MFLLFKAVVRSFQFPYFFLKDSVILYAFILPFYYVFLLITRSCSEFWKNFKRDVFTFTVLVLYEIGDTKIRAIEPTTRLELFLNFSVNKDDIRILYVILIRFVFGSLIGIQYYKNEHVDSRVIGIFALFWFITQIYIEYVFDVHTMNTRAFIAETLIPDIRYVLYNTGTFVNYIVENYAACDANI